MTIRISALRRFSLGHLKKVLGSSIALFTLVWILVFLAVFAFSLVEPVIPYLVKAFAADEAASVAMIGLLNSVFNLAKTLTNIPGGIFADKLGRRSLIISSSLIFPISFILYYFSKNYYYLVAGSLVSGVAMGLSIPAFSALIADIIPATSMSTAYGVFNLSWTLSQIPAPILGGFLSDAFDERFPFLVALAIAITALIASFLIPEPGDERGRRETGEAKTDDSSYVDDRKYKRSLSLFVLVELLNGLGNGVLATLFVVYPLYVLGVSALEMGLVFSIGWGVATAFSQIPGGWLADKVGEKPLILGCLIAFIPLLVLMAFTRTLIEYMLILGVSTLIANLSNPAYSAWLASSIPSSKRGIGFGWTSAAFGAGMIVGPVIGSFVWNLFYPYSAAAFAAAAIFFLLSLPVIKEIP